MRTVNANRKDRVRCALPVIWLAVMLLLSSQRGDASSAASLRIATWIRDTLALPCTAGTVNLFIRKSAHAILYGTEGILIYNALKGCSHAAAKAVLMCTALSFADEYHKIFVPGRHCHGRDIALNAAAALLAISAGAVISKKKASRRKSRR